MFNPQSASCGRTITRMYYSVPYSFVCGTHNARFGHLTFAALLFAGKRVS